MRVFAALFLASAALLAQAVPGRYVVELSAPSLGNLSRPGNTSATVAARRVRINSEQRTARLWIEQRKGRFVSSLNGVMNALVVDAPGIDESTLAAMPGALHIYPVRMAYAVLDHALALHSVPQAWTAAGGVERAGAGVKIAMIDTGISAKHPGFQDSAMQVPAGYPLYSRPENKALTNNKIIVARDYAQFYNLNNQTDTAADRNGHGTATAMCAAGAVTQAPFGRISGVAPKAWLGIYKIAPLNSGSASEDAIAKALDDALADGMDVVNISFDSPFVTPLEKDIVATSIERATELGMIVVVSGGNGGPDPSSIQDLGSIPSAISVGASDSDRSLSPGVTVSGTQFVAFTSSSPLPAQPLSAPLADFNQMAGDSSLCSPQPAGSAAGRILLSTIGLCLFETQINVAEAAGASGLILAPDTPFRAPSFIGAGQAKLPAVMVSFQDAVAMRAALSPDKEVTAKISFGGLAFPLDPMALYGFSSRGPTYTYQMKPDLSATGYVYTATQSTDPQGALFDAGGYITISGTSFSSPLVAGAAAALKAARPGLTVNDYRSLLINSATPLMLRSGTVERVQRTGSGTLNLEAALGDSIAALPTSLSFGTGPGALDTNRRLTLTNVGKKADTFTITSSPYDDAPVPLFSPDPNGTGAAKLLTLAIDAGQSKTVYVFWRFSGLNAGEYQGLIGVQSSASSRAAFVPYWHAVPSGNPAVATMINGVPSQLTSGRSITVYFRVVDAQGIPVLDPKALRFSGTVVAGNGSVSSLTFSDTYPNLVYVTLKLGPDPGTNIFRVVFANLPARTFSVTGTR